MLISFETAAKMINEGKVLHIAGSENLLKKLPKGNWIGGSTEYFMASEGKVSGDLLFATEFPYRNFSVKTYDIDSIENVAADAFDDGFTLLVVPFNSAVATTYAQNAADYKDMFIKKVAGWVSGVNLNVPGQTPVTANGVTGEIFSQIAVALHLETPGQTAIINIINIFTQDEGSPEIEFTEEGFYVKNCLVNGKETVFADYIADNNIDIKLPLVANYSGNGINVSFKSIENGVVSLYAPVFAGVKYKIAKSVPDYVKEFQEHLAKHTDTKAVFSCNCALNFLYGELEGKTVALFAGPITFGEIAYQLVNQTLVYVTVE